MLKNSYMLQSCSLPRERLKILSYIFVSYVDAQKILLVESVPPQKDVCHFFYTSILSQSF